MKKNRIQFVESHLTWTPGDPGVKIADDLLTFFCAADTRDEVELLLLRPGTNEILEEVSMKADPLCGSIRSIGVKGLNCSETEYLYRVNGQKCLDPYATLLRGREKFGTNSSGEDVDLRCAIACVSDRWKEDRPLRLKPEDVTAYSFHVRGLTRSRTCRIKDKGTFRGVAGMLPQIVSLGVNQLILMPAYDFTERGSTVRVGTQASGSRVPETYIPRSICEKMNYWGYTGDAFYMAPKASFSASGRPELEFAELVASAHQHGAEVIMEFAFPSGTDPEAAVHIMTYWIRTYHVDGFRLLCEPDILMQAAKSAQLSRTKLMGDYFDMSRKLFRDSSARRFLADDHNGFRDVCRRLLKGDENQLEDFVRQMTIWDEQKANMVSITGHDGFTLMDLVSYDRKHNEENGEDNRDGAPCEFSWNCGEEGATRRISIRALRLRQAKNAMMMLLLSRGTPVLLAGDECCNSQMGNSNPYCIDSELTWVNWNRTRQAGELRDFICRLIRFRKEHPILTRPDPPGSDQGSAEGTYPAFSCHSGRAWYGVYEYQNRHIGLMYCSTVNEKPQFLYIAYNMYWKSQTLAVPYLPEGYGWRCVLETGNTLPEGEVISRELELPGRTACILEGAAD